MAAEASLVRMDGRLKYKLRHQAFAQNKTQYELLNEIVANWLKSQPELMAKANN